VATVTKKITSFLFILLGLAPLLAIVFFTVRKQNIQTRMKEKLEHHLLQTIVIPENNVTWIKKHEIRVNNRMFDIKTKKLENGVYTFTGLYDDEETKLTEQEKNAAGKNNEQNKLLAQFLKHLSLFFHYPDDNFTLSIQDNNFSFFIAKSPVFLFREILTPPPQV
jgi:hypothetical protein